MAGLIPQTFIDQLLDRVDIVDLIDSFVPLKKAGNNYKACCPFHGEKTPSFTVSQDKQFYHCFGCGAHGTAISFLMEYDHQEFRDAVKSLAQQVGMEIPNDGDHQQKPSAPKDGIDLYDLLSKVSHYYEQLLKSHPQATAAKDYLQARGLTGKIAKRYQLGFAPDAWDTVLKHFGSNAKTQEALMQVGLLSKNEKGRIYDRFRHRIIFPIQDYRGRMVGFGGRVMDDGEPKYLNSPETPVFHKGSELYGLYQAKGEIRKLNIALAVEGYMDVIALAQYDINVAVAALGTALTPSHLERLFRFTPKIIISFDGDRAGKKAAWRAMENSLSLLQDGRQVNFLFLPEGEDPDSMVRKIGKDAFMQLVQDAQPLSDFLLGSLQQEANLQTLEGRAKLANDSKAYVNKLPNGMLKTLLLEQITKITQIDTQVLNQNIVEPDKPAARPLRPVINTRNTRPMVKSKIRFAISLILQNPGLSRIAGDLNSFKESNEAGNILFAEIVETIRSHSGLNTASLIERFRSHAHFDALIKLSMAEVLESNEEVEPMFVSLIKDLNQELVNSKNQSEIDSLLQKDLSELTSQEKEKIKNHTFKT